MEEVCADVPKKIGNEKEKKKKTRGGSSQSTRPTSGRPRHGWGRTGSRQRDCSAKLEAGGEYWPVCSLYLRFGHPPGDVMVAGGTSWPATSGIHSHREEHHLRSYCWACLPGPVCTSPARFSASPPPLLLLPPPPPPPLPFSIFALVLSIPSGPSIDSIHLGTAFPLHGRQSARCFTRPTSLFLPRATHSTNGPVEVLAPFDH